jgi:hypothetical protein
MLNKLIGERDWSAREISHFMLSFPAQECSRRVITLDCRLAKDQNDLISVEEETITARQSLPQQCQARLTDTPGASLLPMVTLFGWLRLWDW